MSAVPDVRALVVAGIPLASGLLAGAASTWLSLRSSRRATPDAAPAPDAVAWTQLPVPIGEQGAVHGAFIGLHSASVLAMAVLFAWDRAQRTSALSSTPALLASAAFLLTSVLAGVAIGFPIVHARAGAAAVLVDSGGVRWGRFFRGWSGFRHVTTDASSRTLRLHSAVMPRAERIVLRAPSDATFDAAVRVARAALPASAPTDAPGPSPTTPVLLAAVAGAVAIALGVLVAGTAWGWAYYLPATLALLRFAPAILGRFGLD